MEVSPSRSIKKMLIFPTYENSCTLLIEKLRTSRNPTMVQPARIRNSRTLAIMQHAKIIFNRVFTKGNATSFLRKSSSPFFLQELRPLTPLKTTDRLLTGEIDRPSTGRVEPVRGCLNNPSRLEWTTLTSLTAPLAALRSPKKTKEKTDLN
jgi:hypothetical protein